MSILKNMQVCHMHLKILVKINMHVHMQDFQWTAIFFAVQELELDYRVLDYLLRSQRVDVTHVDKVGHHHDAEYEFANAGQ